MFLLSVLLYGCGPDAGEILPLEEPNVIPSQQGTSPLTVDEPDTSLTGELQSIDTNNDGVDDTLTYKYDAVEVAPDLYAEKSITLTAQQETFDGEILIAFFGDGDGSYIEVIPKTFASSVDELTFSVEPDNIIEDDPVVEWILGKSKQRINEIRISIEGKALQEGGADAFSAGMLSFYKEADNYAQGKGFSFDKVMNSAKKAGETTGKKAAVEKLWDHMEDMLFLSDLQICKSKSNEGDMHNCVLNLMAKHPAWFKEKDCTEIFVTQKAQAMCKAVLLKDKTPCDTLLSPAENEYCRAYASSFLAGNCPQNDAEKLFTCYYDYAVKFQWQPLCEKIPDPVVSTLCKAEVTQAWNVCKNIDKDFRADCCGKLKDEETQKKCISQFERQIKLNESLKMYEIKVDPEDKKLETGKRYTFHLVNAKEGPDTLFIFDFNSSDHQPYKSLKPYYTVSYPNKGKYKVTVLEMQNDTLVGSGELIIDIGYPYDPLEEMQKCTHLSVAVCGDAIQKEKSGKESDYAGFCNQIYYAPVNITWNDVAFSADFEEKGENHIKISIVGSVNANASRLVSYSAEYYSEHISNGNIGKAALEVHDIPLTPKNGQLPKVRSASFKPVFTGLEKDDVKSHVDANTKEIIKNHLGDPDYWLNYNTVTYDTKDSTYIAVVFSTADISANDIPR